MGTSYPRDIIVPLECDSINIYTNLKGVIIWQDYRKKNG